MIASSITRLRLTWSPLELPGFEWKEELVRARIDRVLESWVDTPYREGSQVKGRHGGADCIRFLCGALDELSGRHGTPVPSAAPDTAMSDPRRAGEILQLIRDAYAPNEDVRGREVQPGDVIVTRNPFVAAGPGHAIVVGARPWVLYHASRKRVKRTGFGLSSRLAEVHAVFRILTKHEW